MDQDAKGCGEKRLLHIRHVMMINVRRRRAGRFQSALLP